MAAATATLTRNYNSFDELVEAVKSYPDNEKYVQHWWFRPTGYLATRDHFGVDMVVFPDEIKFVVKEPSEADIQKWRKMVYDKLNGDISLEEVIGLISEYPYGKYLYKLEVEGVTYYHFANWTATEEMIKDAFQKRVEAGEFWV